MPEKEQSLSKKIHSLEKTHNYVDTKLTTDERVLARITDGIYRQPASALRELISNAYDADAAEVIIQTDAPRFEQISVRDNGSGLTPEVLEHLIQHIGGSAKRASDGKDLGVTSDDDENLSPGGRKLIGKLGIGLFSVAQFTRHFLIITKTKDDPFRTVVDIILGPVAGQQKSTLSDRNGGQQIETGSARIWRERADDKSSHGTEIKLLELLPRTRAELASEDLWARVDYQNEDSELVKTIPPKLHIGRMKPHQSEVLQVQPQLPWDENDSPRDRFSKLVQAVRNASETYTGLVDLDIYFDHYLQTLWNLALACPLEYLDSHPFDLKSDKETIFFELENKPKGQAKRLNIKGDDTPRTELKLKAPYGLPKDVFKVYIDGVQLFRPILFKDLPKTGNVVQTPLLFIGHDSQKFEKKSETMSGGPLIFEAYLFWAPKIVPKQHQGVVLRVGNASGALFDKTFMGYQVSEQTRLRQITAEIFIHEGLDGAINLDRESFNYAHPHYQYLVKWLHSALRQFANRQKEIGKKLRSEKIALLGKKFKEEIQKRIEEMLLEIGVDDVPEVVFVEDDKSSATRKLRNDGTIALRKNVVMPKSDVKYKTEKEEEEQKKAEKKAIAIAQLLSGWGLLENLSYDDQEKLVRHILEIVLLD
jgi:hypothetical protein